MRRLAPALAMLLGLGLPAPDPAVQAQELRAADAGETLPAMLSADSVTYDRETGLLVASGDVEVLYQGRVLRAARITYDERAERIRAEGPIVLTDPDGGVLLADAAALTPDLEEGLISSARLLIDGQLQLAATEMRRTGGRYATLQRTIASSCTICAGNPTPTWAIRASRITEDSVAQRLYFENARLEAFGFPIAYVPRLSIPEPGVARASGVLPPVFQQSDIYGFGFKLPYYRVLGPSSDTTITPFVTTEGGFLLEGEYRRRFSNGGFNLWGVVGLADTLDENGTSHDGAGRGAVERRRPLPAAARLRRRLRPQRRDRQELPDPVRLHRCGPAHQRRPGDPHPGVRLLRGRDRRLPEPDRRRRRHRRALRLPGVLLPPPDGHARASAAGWGSTSTPSASGATRAA